MRFTCVIDTCSYIYLNKCKVFREKTALELLHTHTNIVFSPAVEDEISDHYERPMPNKSQRRTNVRKTNFLSSSVYELQFFGDNLARRAPDKGERDNFSLMADLYLSGKKVGIVFLSDDENAAKKVLNDVWGCFPIGHKWCSLDVILFLYIIKAIPTKNLAEDAIKDIDNIIVPNNPDRNKPHTTLQKQTRIAKYLAHLNVISSILN